MRHEAAELDLLNLDALVSFVAEWRANNPTGGKDDLVSALTESFKLDKKGALLIGVAFVVRVSQNTSDSGFPNTVVAFRRIVEHDDRPVVACLVSPNRCQLLLANTTFLRKVSHSSHGLSEQRLVGSILGSDIVSQYNGVPNAAEHLGALWIEHEKSDRAAHLARIIAATQAIAPRPSWSPSLTDTENILAAPTLHELTHRTPEYLMVARSIQDAIQLDQAALLTAARDPNAKRRGDRIEQLVTGAAKSQGLGDLVITVLTTTISIDVKSKRLDLPSAPKAYNVDKMLRDLARGNRLLSILFVGIDLGRQRVSTRLASIFDSTVLGATRVTPQWSARGSRGTAQFWRRLDAIWADNYEEAIDVRAAEAFLRNLLVPP